MHAQQQQTVYLFLTDKETDAVLDAYSAIRRALQPDERSCILFHQKEAPLSDDLSGLSPYVFTDETLVSLNYTPIYNVLVPGSTHFPILQYFREFPDYRYYWVIEDDVRFTGDWGDFFSYFNRQDHDLITSHIRRFDDEPDWPWWHTLSHNGEKVPQTDLLRSFNPVYRISGRALRFIHDALSRKWKGHHEVLLPTLLNRHPYKLLDFGGEGDFVASENANKFYTSGQLDRRGSMRDGTMRFRPAMTAPGDQKNKLYHPVKPDNELTAAQREFNHLLHQQMIWGSDIYALSLLMPIFGTSYLPFTKASLRPTCLAMILNDIVLNQRTTIIEFGSGVSTVAIARLIRANRLEARLFSIDQHEPCLELVAGQLKKEQLEDMVELIHAPLAPCEHAADGSHWYDTALLNARLQGCRPDLVIVDGPLNDGGPNGGANGGPKTTMRYPALPFLHERLAPAVSVYLDDVDREGEKQIMKKWSSQFALPFDSSDNSFGFAARGDHFDPRPF